jgi:chromatin remodeling complex protein RSC6
MVSSINTHKSTTKSVEKVTVKEPDTPLVKKTRTKKTVEKVENVIAGNVVAETPSDTENTIDEIVENTIDEIVENTIDESKPIKKNSEQTESVFLSKLTSFLTKVSVVNKEVRELQTIGRTLEKDFNAVVRALSKKKNKHRNNENRALSGFAMPSLLSNELYTFLDIQEGTLIPRKQVTRMLNEYIKENNLRNETDRRIILPDDNLKRIFNCTENDNVTYFNLQSFVKHHFIKEIKVVVPTVEDV